MNWTQNLSGMYVARSYDAGMPAVEATSLQELFAQQAERETQVRVKASQQRAINDRAQRLAALQHRIQKTLKIDKDPVALARRGAKRAVVVLHVTDGHGNMVSTPIDASTGRPPVFESTSEAGKYIGQKSEQVCQAIRRGGTAGRVAFQYCDRLEPAHPCYRLRRGNNVLKTQQVIDLAARFVTGQSDEGPFEQPLSAVA